MCVSHMPSWKVKLLGSTAARYSTSRTLKSMRQQYLMSQGSPPRMKIARLFPAEYPWFFETHHKYLLGFGEHRSKKWLLPSSVLDSQAISVRRVQPTTHFCYTDRASRLYSSGSRT